MFRPIPLLAAMLFLASPMFAAEPADLAAKLRDLPPAVLPAEKSKENASMLANHARARIRAANLRESKLWRQIENRADWERYRDPRLQALRRSLGQPLPHEADLKVRITNTLMGDGYRIENLVFESRPGLMVAANLYSPKVLPKRMPGIIICPSHHNPKTQGELQDMGMSWARLGCLVLVPDNLGHGERRQHPFTDASQYSEKFRVGRQDYYFRYNTSLQLYAVGESLAGWMVGDLIRCVDVLLARPGIDKERILLLGSVAGGGDPAAVAGAIDPRIAGGRAVQLRRPATGDDPSATRERRRCLQLRRRRQLGIDPKSAPFRPRRLPALGHRRRSGAPASHVRSRICLGQGTRSGLGAFAEDLWLLPGAGPSGLVSRPG